MRVLLLTPDFPPTANSAARLYAELAKDLDAAGHQITVITRRVSSSRRWGGVGQESSGRTTICRVPGTPLPRKLPSARAVDQAAMAAAFYWAGRRLTRHDVILVYSPPQPLVLVGAALARRWGCPLVVNVQDLYPQTGTDLELLRGPALWASRWMERFLYRRADAITVLSAGARAELISRGAMPDQVHVLSNWVDLDQVRQGPADESWLAAQGLAGRFVVSFAGTMGFAQGLDGLIDAALLLSDVKDITVVLAGRGVLRSDLEERARSLGLENVRFLPMLGEADYLTLLRSSAVNIASLDRRLKVAVVPGKLQVLMATGRPLLCIANPATGLGELIDDAGCGLFVPSGRPDALADAIRMLHTDAKRTTAMGKAGRAFAEAHYRRHDVTGAYERLLGNLARNAHSERVR